MPICVYLYGTSLSRGTNPINGSTRTTRTCLHLHANKTKS